MQSGSGRVDDADSRLESGGSHYSEISQLTGTHLDECALEAPNVDLGRVELLHTRPLML